MGQGVRGKKSGKMMGMVGCWVGLIAIVGLGPSTLPAFEEGVFERMSEGERLSIVIEALRGREAGVMGNYSYQLAATSSEVDADGVRQTVEQRWVEMRRRGEVVRVWYREEWPG